MIIITATLNPKPRASVALWMLPPTSANVDAASAMARAVAAQRPEESVG